MKKIFVASILVSAAVGLAVIAAEAPVPVPSTEEPQAAFEQSVPAEQENACVELETSETLDLDGLALTAAAPRCKTCKDRPFCTCSYQGKPRISCNPCCWQGPLDPFPICAD